ncbi:type II toxin-antitoxin system death-on-curing family toxin [Raoultibacter phocaeensis]|uniref:type II toxin-antitoxin system death-on-curing family toxin n=1 Tax=Raoultibacter phocaeensis TaxID=2479841 RepID=UPI00111887AD|nr:type II toxin-antitoxin system death-on-curing family toxin [Raoultibacter phocaeensis]
MKRDWRYLELSEVIAVHEYLLDQFGGSEGVRDTDLLESALAQPRQTFDGEDLYQTSAEKAARYAFGIVNNHPFVDGNKRTGAACLGMFLRGNDVRFKPRGDDLYRTIIAVADGSLSYNEFVAWVEAVIG